jgi:tRNA(fMet)-specific endonuclease VapC
MILKDCPNPLRKSAKTGKVLTHLLDTDICIFTMKGRDRALAQRLDELAEKSAISDLTIFELYSGADRYDSPISRTNIIDDFASRLKVLPFDSKAARIAGPLRYKLRTSGQMIGAYDLLIAATALTHDLTLMTKNVREYQRVPGLKVEQWL